MPRTWLVTGCSRGLGRQLAEAVLVAGHNLVATARRPEMLADLIARHPGQARAAVLDVTNRAQAADAVRAAVETFDRLDVVVNNAGHGSFGALEDVTEEDFRAQIETNLWGVINVTRAALPVLRQQRAGHIIQISSIGGRVAMPGIGPYLTAKWGVEGFSGALRQEVGHLGIRVTVVEPGGLRTDWATKSMDVHDVREDYLPVLGPMLDLLRTETATIGDPRRAAQAILRIAEVDDPPLHLLLGSDAYELARAADQARLTSDEAWRELTISTDRDDATWSQEDARAVPGAPAPAQ
jgi:NAD(P)-dependent dehydrogenase (short-subunit alcohol dehydrogenase family)